MSLMGPSSKDLLIYATEKGNSKLTIPLFFLIKKTDGSVASTFNLNDTNIEEVEPPSNYDYKFKLVSAKSP